MYKCMDISPGDDTTLWCRVSRNPPGVRPTTLAERDAEMVTCYSSQSFAPFDKEVGPIAFGTPRAPTRVSGPADLWFATQIETRADSVPYVTPARFALGAC